jgi:hypothetical protein
VSNPPDQTPDQAPDQAPDQLPEGNYYLRVRPDGTLSSVAYLHGGAIIPVDAEPLHPAFADMNARFALIRERIAEADANQAHAAAVHGKYRELHILDEARGLLDAVKAGQAPELDAVTLTDLVAQPDDPETYRVDGLWPSGGRVLLAAAAKTGKTTLVGANLLRCLVDGGDFLGRMRTTPATGRVLYLNMELAAGTMRRWLRDTPISDTDRVIVANLRGKAAAVTLHTQPGRERFAEFLRRHSVEVVLLDPLAPLLASLGLDENSNADVARFFAWWSETLTAAGVTDDLIVHHTGHNGHRSRGASRLMDEPDALWTLTRSSRDVEGPSDFDVVDEPRFLAAHGRDVDLPPEALHYNPATRELTLTGHGRAAVATLTIDQAIRDVMGDGEARSKSAIRDEAVARGHSNNRVWDRIGHLITTGHLVDVGKKRYVWPDAVTPK